jgi:muramidase (phage lysozyme)
MIPLIPIAAIAIGLYAMANGSPEDSAMSAATTPNATPPAPDVQMANVAAFLAVLRWCEGTSDQPDPYSTTFGYAAPLIDLTVNPWDSGQVGDASTPSGPTHACGAYQIEPGSWEQYCSAAGADRNDFSPNNQDGYAMWAIDVKRGAGDDVRAGRVQAACLKLHTEWASLPPGVPGQPCRTVAQVQAQFVANGGTLG